QRSKTTGGLRVIRDPNCCSDNGNAVATIWVTYHSQTASRLRPLGWHAACLRPRCRAQPANAASPDARFGHRPAGGARVAEGHMTESGVSTCEAVAIDLAAPPAAPPAPRRTLVLSGGGGRGVWQVGACEHRILERGYG